MKSKFIFFFIFQIFHNQGFILQVDNNFFKWIQNDFSEFIKTFFVNQKFVIDQSEELYGGNNVQVPSISVEIQSIDINNLQITPQNEFLLEISNLVLQLYCDVELYYFFYQDQFTLNLKGNIHSVEIYFIFDDLNEGFNYPKLKFKRSFIDYNFQEFERESSSSIVEATMKYASKYIQKIVNCQLKRLLNESMTFIVNEQIQLYYMKEIFFNDKYSLNMGLYKQPLFGGNHNKRVQLTIDGSIKSENNQNIFENNKNTLELNQNQKKMFEKPSKSIKIYLKKKLFDSLSQVLKNRMHWLENLFMVQPQQPGSFTDKGDVNQLNLQKRIIFLQVLYQSI